MRRSRGNHEVSAIVKLRRREDGGAKKNKKTRSPRDGSYQVRKTELK
jgi:hypothetical protein